MPIYRNNYFVKRTFTPEMKELYAEQQLENNKWLAKLNRVNKGPYSYYQYKQTINWERRKWNDDIYVYDPELNAYDETKT